MERLMQYIWQHRLWTPPHITTVNGQRLQIIDPGRLNTDAGPDFFNAKIKIDGNTWVGNIEIHHRASDWFRHRHHLDPAYDSVILHIVDLDDTPIHRADGQIIPQLRMPCSPHFRQRYQHLVDNSAATLPCTHEIAQTPPIYLIDWLDSLALMRLHDKVDRIDSHLNRLAGDWQETCYITVARSLGFGINSDPFERLARSLPLRFLSHHTDSLLSIEALLFGQAGLLNQDTDSPENPYLHTLRDEYRFLAHKFNLTPLQSPGWKMARMRPANFPHRRIALLATLTHGGFRMMSQILEAATIDDARRLFSPTLTGYWADHYTFRPVTSSPSPAISRQSVDILIINALIPLIYAYSIRHNQPQLRQRALTLLHALPSEANSIVTLFNSAGIASPDAFTSQALIQLRRQFCEPRKCLYCRIGHRMLAREARR